MDIFVWDWGFVGYTSQALICWMAKRFTAVLENFDLIKRLTGEWAL